MSKQCKQPIILSGVIGGKMRIFSARTDFSSTYPDLIVHKLISGSTRISSPLSQLHQSIIYR